MEGSDAERFAQSWEEVVAAWKRHDDAATLLALQNWIEIWDVCFWKGDFSSFPTAYHSNVLIANNTRLQGLSPFRGGEGIDAFRRLREESSDVLSWFRFQIESIERSGDRVAALGTMRTRGRLSGLGIRVPFATIWTILDGKIARAEGFTSRRLALRTLRAGTLEPRRRDA
ncbi:MAG: nuclear transport factor 2 family protein [Actinomycetota bacterium]|nr:nuclear transport factor 2 family protein [Actinomycetota bacterium]